VLYFDVENLRMIGGAGGPKRWVRKGGRL
jgi:hypothetical protein